MLLQARGGTMSSESSQLLIVGGSYAACELAAQARANGFGEKIIIVSEEDELPYHRPPLSKTYLKEPLKGIEPLRADVFYSANDVGMELGVRVVSIDRVTSSAELSNGKHIGFGILGLGVGASARKMSCPGAELGNVYYLRSIADARKLSAAATDAEKVVIIGTGFIGLEVASVLAQQQKHVTVIGTADRVLARAVAPETSEFLSSVHASRGVKFMTSRTVESLKGENGVVRRVLLDDGTSLDADIVIVGIGAVPNLELAKQLGLRIENGIVVDAQARTSLTNVFATGDCTAYRGPFNTAGLRLESVQNATDQSRVAGAVIAGVDRSYDSVPWFWSDQYDLKLQIAGVPGKATQRVVRAGSGSELSVFHFRDDICVCVESIGRPREHISMRRLLQQREISKRELEDLDFDAPALLKR